MKKLIILAFIAIIMAGCDGNEFNKVHFHGYQVIDSCEYITGVYRITHKGNCKYCASRRKQELQSIVEQLKEE